jgi:hypothetical protein
VIAPVEDDMVRPVGSAGDMAYEMPPEPPAPVTGVKDVAALLMVSDLDATAWVAVTAVFTVRLNVAVADPLLASVTVTV